jgi:hypothetical protein
MREHRWRAEARFAAVALVELAVLGLIGCMRSARIGDAALKPFDSMYSIDRARYGFTPLPRTGRVSIEGRSLQGEYDAMLHFEGNPYRTIAFRWDGKAYQWLGEQEEFEGPGIYETDDGRFHEQIAITYYKEAVWDERKGLLIQYFGPEPRSLKLEEASPLIKKWGYGE